MDIDRECIRREAKDIDGRHRRAMKRDRATLDRLVSGDGAKMAADDKADLILGGMHRRRFLVFGGVSVLTSSVFSACAGAKSDVKAAPTSAPPTTAKPPTSAKDATILRTASSIEALAISVYAQALKSGLIKSPTLLALVKLFQSQHNDHGELFQRSTTAAGGTPFMDPNPVLLSQVVQPRLAALKTEMDVVDLAYDLEHLASATYQGDVGMFDNVKLNVTVASVGGTEARHVALLAMINGKSASGTPDNAFQVTTDAVRPGTGV